MAAGLSLKSELIESKRPIAGAPTTFAACLNAHGTYTTEQFVLRLSPRVHSLIDSVSPGIHQGPSISVDVVQAYSTYLHETIHWWQHMGSTAGLVFSLAYPAQCHVNLGHLRTCLAKIGPKKSIRTWAENRAHSGREDDDVREANIVVNNAMDVEFYKQFSLDPACAEEIFEDRYFESIGHSYWMAYGHLLAMLSGSFDPTFSHLPDARTWDVEFPKLKAAGCLGFYHGSPIERGRVGLHALFEGQARFCQLQYLTFGIGKSLTCQDLRKKGYLSGIYVTAFEEFLSLTKLAWPERIDDPVVAIFLLICDLSLNPGVGFPFQISEYREFIHDVDPGIRFTKLCMTVAQTVPTAKSAITAYSKEEYVRVSEQLSAACNYDSPMRILGKVVKMKEEIPEFRHLVDEQKLFKYDAVNLPVRVLFSHFLAFSSDKLENPEFFCWPGAWMAGERASTDIQRLFLSHLSLFSDREDDDGVFPRNFPDKDPDGLRTMFNSFFGVNVVYDLTRQVILNDGPFVYDLKWLSSSHKDEDMRSSANELFERVYGVNPDSFELQELRAPGT